MVISQYVVGFVFFSFCGWIWECGFVMMKTGKWDNRGFLFGPYCPIYGVAVMIAYFIFTADLFPVSTSSNPLVIFLICMIGSAIIEYTTSYILEKKYHARWWDYSYLPFNLNGRIALPVSVAFGLFGIVVVRYILPYLSGFKPSGPSLWVEGLSILLTALMATDFGMTIASLSEIVKRINEVEEQFGDRVQLAYDRIDESRLELKDQLDSYSEYVKMRVNEAAEHLSAHQAKTMHRVQFTGPNKKYIADRLEEHVKERKSARK